MTDEPINRKHIAGRYLNSPICIGCRSRRVGKKGELKCSICRTHDNYVPAKFRKRDVL